MTETVDVVIPFSAEHTPREMFLEAYESAYAQESVNLNVIKAEDENQFGPAWARNEGMLRSDARYIAFLDADDIWTDQTKIFRQIAALESADAAISICGIEKRPDDQLLRDIFLERETALTSGILIDAEKTSAIWNEALYRREDHLFIMEAILDQGAAIIEDDLYQIRQHDGGLSSRESPRKKMEAYADFYDEATDLVPGLSAYRDHYWHHAYHRVGRILHFSGDYGRAFSYLMNGLEHRRRPKTMGAAILSKIAEVRAR